MLPNFLKPKYKSKFVRLGGPNDGGYLVEINSLKISEILISLGINDDWKFEKDFSKYVGNIISIDDKLSLSFLIKRLVKLILFFKSIKNIFKYIYLIIDYLIFFSKKNTLLIKALVTNYTYGNCIDLDFIFKKNQIFSKKIFLKIDIEGFEYRILDDILKYENSLTGLIIEFHNTDLNYTEIENFINNINLKLVHVHANNYGYLNKSKDPTVLELTFSKFGDELIDDLNLPHQLDSSNDPNKSDIKLSFKNV